MCTVNMFRVCSRDRQLLVSVRCMRTVFMIKASRRDELEVMHDKNV